MSIEINDKDPKEYIVIGAGGSGTSFISKALEKAGVHMGNVKTKWHNKFYEDPFFRRVNADILKRAGMTAKDWQKGAIPTEEKIMAVNAEKKMEETIKKRKLNYFLWGFKEPRMAMTGKKWLPLFKDDTYLICVFRKPERVINGWNRSRHFRLVKDKKRVLDHMNRSIISIIKEFCQLDE